MAGNEETNTSRARWLLLIQQLPTRPSSVRIKTWRRLQQLGSVVLKHSVYVLPHTPQAREDFEWLCSEIRGGNGHAAILAAEALTAEQEDEIREAFRAARSLEYDALRARARDLARRIVAPPSGTGRQSVERTLRGLRDEFTRIAAIDFCGAPMRAAAEEALDMVAAKLAPAGVRTGRGRDAETLLDREPYQRRIWVTRPRPGVDRMASAWLIRRFIDSNPRFVFADVEASRVPKRQVPFDMFGAEFGHQGDRCSFETLCDRFGIDDPAVRRVAEIVHQVDLKDGRYPSPEAPVIERLVEGLRGAYTDDHELLQHGVALFAGLCESLGQTSSPARSRQGGTRRTRRTKGRSSTPGR